MSTQVLEICLTHKFLQSGSARATTYQSPQNAHQSVGIRDALAKVIISFFWGEGFMRGFFLSARYFFFFFFFFFFDNI